MYILTASIHTICRVEMVTRCRDQRVVIGVHAAHEPSLQRVRVVSLLVPGEVVFAVRSGLIQMAPSSCDVPVGTAGMLI